MLPYFSGKAEMEEHIKKICLSYSILRPAVLLRAKSETLKALADAEQGFRNAARSIRECGGLKRPTRLGQHGAIGKSVLIVAYKRLTQG